MKKRWDRCKYVQADLFHSFTGCDVMLPLNFLMQIKQRSRGKLFVNWGEQDALIVINSPSRVCKTFNRFFKCLLLAKRRLAAHYAFIFLRQTFMILHRNSPGHHIIGDKIKMNTLGKSKIVF